MWSKEMYIGGKRMMLSSSGMKDKSIWETVVRAGLSIDFSSTFNQD